jgi:hypothetical protein
VFVNGGTSEQVLGAKESITIIRIMNPSEYMNMKILTLTIIGACKKLLFPHICSTLVIGLKKLSSLLPSLVCPTNCISLLEGQGKQYL